MNLVLNINAEMFYLNTDNTVDGEFVLTSLGIKGIKDTGVYYISSKEIYYWSNDKCYYYNLNERKEVFIIDAEYMKKISVRADQPNSVWKADDSYISMRWVPGALVHYHR